MKYRILVTYNSSFQRWIYTPQEKFLLWWFVINDCRTFFDAETAKNHIKNYIQEGENKPYIIPYP